MTQHRQPDRPGEPLDGLLRHSLKSAAAASPCPSPDVLAAYFERSLPAVESAGHELHFAQCTHCQEQLAALARIETTVGASAPVSAQRAPEFSFLNLRWLAPAALAAAGAVALWVVVQPATEPQPTTQIADARKPAADAARTTGPAETAKSSETIAAPSPLGAGAAAETGSAAGAKTEFGSRASNEKDQLAKRAFETGQEKNLAGAPPAPVGRVGALAPKLAQPAVPPTAELADEKKKEVLAAAAEEEAGKRRVDQAASVDGAAVAKLAEQKQQALQSAAEKARQLDRQELAAGIAQQRPTGQAAARPQAPAQQPPLQTVAPQTTESAENRMREAPLAKQAEAPARTGEGFAMRDRANFAPPRPEFSVLAGRIQWRFFKEGVIQRYDERTKGGDLVKSPVTHELLAASAPSEKICWAVGRAGVIIRSENMGPWQVVGSPSDEDLVFIEAKDAQNVTIRTRSGKTYVTSDAARTWRTP